SGHGPSADVLGAKVGGLLTRVGDMYADPFMNEWPGFDPAHIGYVFTFTVEPGSTASLMTFVVKGLSEVYDPPGGFPAAVRDGIVAPKLDPPFTGTPVVPAAGSQIALVTDVARRLAAKPDVRGLTVPQRATILNWNLPAEHVAPFTVVEKTAIELQQALSASVTTSE